MTTLDCPEAAGPGPDLRVNAFVGAWERIEAAQKLKVDWNKQPVDPLPEIYWATMLEAAVLAHLATADEDPGRDAGRYEASRAHRIQEARNRAREVVNRIYERDRAHNPRGTNDVAPCWAEGHRVRVTRGGWAGRTGKITKVDPDNDPPLVDVALDLLHVTDEPVDISVPPADIELEITRR